MGSPCNASPNFWGLHSGHRVLGSVWNASACKISRLLSTHAARRQSAEHAHAWAGSSSALYTYPGNGTWPLEQYALKHWMSNRWLVHSSWSRLKVALSCCPKEMLRLHDESIVWPVVILKLPGCTLGSCRGLIALVSWPGELRVTTLTHHTNGGFITWMCK